MNPDPQSAPEKRIEVTLLADSSQSPFQRSNLTRGVVSRLRRVITLNLLLRVVVGGIFLFAGAIKIADPAKFALAVGNYRVVPHVLTNLIAITLPWIELIAGAFVLVGIRLWAASTVIAGLTVLFFILISSALVRGLNIECGCFGTLGGRHTAVLGLAIDTTLFSLVALLVKRTAHLTGYSIFREAGPQNSALPLKASPKASPVAKRVLSSVVCSNSRG